MWKHEEGTPTPEREVLEGFPSETVLGLSHKGPVEVQQAEERHRRWFCSRRRDIRWNHKDLNKWGWQKMSSEK